VGRARARAARRLGDRRLPARRPSLAVDAAGRVHAAWWSGREGAAGVFYARSDDGGAPSRAVPMGVADALASRARAAGVAPATAAAGPRVVVAWDDGTRNTPVVRVRVSRDGGHDLRPRRGRQRRRPAGDLPGAGGRRRAAGAGWTEERDPEASHAGHGPNMKDRKAACRCRPSGGGRW
jgi:hypothetical protein